MTKTDVGILGATGYTARELLRLLDGHPHVRVTALTTRSADRPHVSEVHPRLTGRFDLTLEPLSATELASRCEIAFCALPHVASMEAVPDLLAGGCRVIDLSADYRLSDPGVYEQWYGHVHTDPTRLGSTVYGLPELFADRIPSADLVANPGCYTSTAILGLAPLLANRMIEPGRIIIDAKSGVSGAGRTPKLNTLFAECNESLTAYGVGTHRHTPEIEQVLSEVSQQNVSVTFTPHLIPMDRGILCTMYIEALGDMSGPGAIAALRDYYAECPFIRVVDHLPATQHVAHTNFCDITVRRNRDQWIVFSALDNLIKGASGVAVQNLNLMLGIDETTSLLPT